MIRRIEDFKTNWQYEVESTLKTLNLLTDNSLSQKVTPDARSLGFLAWHLVQTPREMLALTGLTVDGPGMEDEVPGWAAGIVAEYEKTGNSVAEAVAKNWTDETLLIEDNMYGEKWSRGLTLYYLMAHQTHHRGQMTVLMRQAGLAVPGIYGPAKEEWKSMGMAAPA